MSMVVRVMTLISFSPSQFDHPRANAVNSNRLPRGYRGIAEGEVAILA